VVAQSKGRKKGIKKKKKRKKPPTIPAPGGLGERENLRFPREKRNNRGKKSLETGGDSEKRVHVGKKESVKSRQKNRSADRGDVTRQQLWEKRGGGTPPSGLGGRGNRETTRTL